MLTDAELLIRYANEKSDTAFAELVRRYVDLVYSAAVRQVGGDAHRAQDVTQVVFTTLARKAGSLMRHPVLAAWLYTTTHHAAAKTIRTEMRRQVREQRAHAMNENLADDGAAIDWEQVRPVLDEAMRHLHERDREAVLLRYFAQRPFTEIGAALKVSEDAARMRVERALERLHALLARRGVTSTAGALAAALSHQAVTAAPAGLAASVAGTAVAVASAGAIGAGSVLTGVAMVSHAKLLVTAAVVIACLAVGPATREVFECRVAGEALVRAEERHASLMARVREAEGRARIAEEEEDAAAVRVRKAAKSAAAAVRAVDAAEHARVAKVQVEPREAVAAGDAMLARHPAVRQTIVDWHARKARFQFAPLFESLGLTSQQIDEFVELVRGEVLFGDWGPNGQFVELRTLREMTSDDARARLAALLGEEGYRAYLNFHVIGAAREYAGQVASQLYLVEAPLTGEQAAELGRIFTETRRSHGESSRAVEASYWDTLIEKARTKVGLSPAQIAVLARISTGAQAAAVAHEVRETASHEPETLAP